MDDYRYLQQSPRNEQTMNNLISPPRNGGGGSRMNQSSQTHDQRTSLPRRFTTDSGRVPTLSSITNQRGLPPVSNEPSQEYHVRRLSSKRALACRRLAGRVRDT
jgi:hypothetical protein